MSGEAEGADSKSEDGDPEIRPSGTTPEAPNGAEIKGTEPSDAPPPSLPKFPAKKGPPPPKASAFNGGGAMVILLVGCIAMLIVVRMSARNLVANVEQSDRDPVRVPDVPAPPPTPRRLERPVMDPAVRMTLLANAQKACTANESAACVAAVDQLEAPGDAVDPELLAYRVTSLVHLGETTRASQLARFFVLRFPDHPAKQRVKPAILSAPVPSASARVRAH